jgi:hypothetical protein
LAGTDFAEGFVADLAGVAAFALLVAAGAAFAVFFSGVAGLGADLTGAAFAETGDFFAVAAFLAGAASFFGVAFFVAIILNLFL